MGLRERQKKEKIELVTYNIGDSLVVTDLATNPTLDGFIYRRADGIPSFSVAMVVCESGLSLCDSYSALFMRLRCEVAARLEIYRLFII